MRKHLIEQALQGEMDAHLGYDRYERPEAPIAEMTPVRRRYRPRRDRLPFTAKG